MIGAGTQFRRVPPYFDHCSSDILPRDTFTFRMQYLVYNAHGDTLIFSARRKTPLFPSQCCLFVTLVIHAKIIQDIEIQYSLYLWILYAKFHGLKFRGFTPKQIS